MLTDHKDVTEATHAGASIAPAEYASEVVFICGVVLDGERSTTVTNAGAFPRCARTDHVA